MTMPRVFNKHHGDAPADAVYIGRGSPYGNPFVIGTDGDRDGVIAAYRRWLATQSELVSHVRADLAGRDLVCFCAPAPCHGDVLISVANNPAVEYRIGDLFAQDDVDAIGHGVNCVGAMGAGIAVVFRRRVAGYVRRLPGQV